MLKGKTIVVGVTGGIAAYKMANCVSMLKKLNAEIHVIMTKNAVNFINPITFETLTGNKCLVDTFDRNFQFHVAHVSLGKKANAMLIAPASADIIGKLAGGIADDMLTTSALAMRCKIILAPAMNTAMYNNRIVQDNIKKLKNYGFEIIDADSGHLACGDTGEGKMPSEEVLIDYVLRETRHEKDMGGTKVIVSAGPTLEAIDPVRYISNHSTGKMGYEIAKAAACRGAEVTLVSGKTNLRAPNYIKLIEVTSALEMFNVFKEKFVENDIIIKAAAVADYRPKNIASEKIKKSESEMNIDLERNPDIIKYIGENKKQGQFICGFSMETENMIENSRKKLKNKNIDMIAANNLKQSGAGFGTDTNIITLITKNSEKQLELMSKSAAADVILDEIILAKQNN